MAAPTENPRGAGAWQAMHLQLIAFPTVPASTLPQEWWQELTGEQPEESTRKKQERADQGTYQGRFLTLSADLIRFTWAAGVQATAEMLLENPIPTLGPFPEHRDWFVDTMSRWLASATVPIKRLGFVSKLIQRTDGHAAAYRLIGHYLSPHVHVDPETSDFLYRINRKTRSRTRVPGLSINRLATWGAVKCTVQTQAALPEMQAQFDGPVSEGYACSVDLDINTAHEFSGQLPPTELPSLFQELVALGTEIAEHGGPR